jgi:hypothetical protein
MATVKMLDRDGNKLVKGTKVVFASSDGIDYELRARVKGWHIAGIKWVSGSGWAVGVSWGEARPETAASVPWYFPGADERPNTYRCLNLVALPEPHRAGGSE